MNPLDVVVIGGGAIGLASAWRLANDGHAVTVCDPDPGRAATHASAGMIAPVSETHFGEEVLQQLNLAGAARWPDFAAELESVAGSPSGFRRTGSVAVAFDRDDKRELDRLHDRQLELGLAAERLSAAECRQRAPMLSPRLTGGLWIEGDHQADNRRLVATLLEVLAATEVQVTRQSVQRVETGVGAVTGVVLDDGTRLASDVVVVAAGAWSGAIEGMPESAIPPVRPVKGQIIRLRGPAGGPRLDPCIRALVRGHQLYLVPRLDGRIVIGATQEEMGFDTTVTAEGIQELLSDAIDLCPGLADHELVETLAGLRPGTPDNGPVVGATPIDGLIVASGHFRHGILLTPITADAVADIVAGRPRPHELLPFGPERFHDEVAA